MVWNEGTTTCSSFAACYTNTKENGFKQEIRTGKRDEKEGKKY